MPSTPFEHHSTPLTSIIGSYCARATCTFLAISASIWLTAVGTGINCSIDWKALGAMLTTAVISSPAPRTSRSRYILASMLFVSEASVAFFASDPWIFCVPSATAFPMLDPVSTAALSNTLCAALEAAMPASCATLPDTDSFALHFSPASEKSEGSTPSSPSRFSTSRMARRMSGASLTRTPSPSKDSKSSSTVGPGVALSAPSTAFVAFVPLHAPNIAWVSLPNIV
mmetsp:Transcript_93288/g.264085  ORF Transcript_93288/g.264085 Transcript_93288/m.264085 type:complete len:227 (+) Transcript_93288:193-873(+)